MKPSPRLLLGQKLFWTEKKDGSNVAIWLEDVSKIITKPKEDNVVMDDVRYYIHISSRNQVDAASDIKALVKRTKEYPKILELLKQNSQFTVYVEACRKGRSVTGAELYDEDYVIVFDIYDRSAKKFLPYINTHQHCYHHDIPIVKLWAETRHTSMKDLLKWKNYALKYCETVGLEGMVIKAYKIPDSVKVYFKTLRCGLIQAKVKLDVPQPINRKIAKGEPILPSIPENEILGAIDKVWQDVGTEKFKKIEVVMPLIAKAVGEECKKHLYSSPKKKLFIYYKKYLERMLT